MKQFLQSSFLGLYFLVNPILGAEYLGCYLDKSFKPDYRLMPELKNDFPGTLTPKICQDHCEAYHFRYAGVENKTECFCSRTRPTHKASAPEEECNAPCDGDQSKMCGGNLRLSAYDLKPTKGVNHVKSNYVGCFADSFLKRTLSGFENKEVTNLTPEACVRMCYSKGFRFAGVEHFKECFCGRLNIVTEREADSDCSTPCVGDNGIMCGGHWRISVYDTGFQDPDQILGEYLGCFVDKMDKPDLRLMPELKKVSPGILTPLLCQQFCKSNNFRYAGVEERQECYCSNKRPSFTAYAFSEDCNTPCDGDQSQMCGGKLRLSVYDLEAKKGINYVAQNHIGCFSDSSEKRTLDGWRFENITNLTPEMCVGMCFSKGYRFAGTELDNECFCGERHDEKRRQEDDDCSLPCTGDNQIQCGSYWRISVYSTGIPDLAHNNHRIGCFEDEYERNRLLFENKMRLYTINSPKKCFNICTMLGYKYAGVQYGDECYCGNRRPPADLEVDSSECYFPCPGTGETVCGGNWRLLVYSTGTLRDSEQVIQTSVYITKSPSSGSRPRPSKPTPSWLPSSLRSACVTTVKNEPVCDTRVIFQDDFSSNELSADKWSHLVFIPTMPDYEFVVFDKDPENSYVKNGQLFIQPTVQPDGEIRGGSITLKNCKTQLVGSRFGMCAKQASGYNILPPIKSARISSKGTFSFKYGEVTVRARLPLGDWLIPEIWLEPKSNVYGPGYRSGRIKIVSARGNPHLVTEDGDEIGIQRTESGVLLGNGNARSSIILEKKVRHNLSLSENEVNEYYKNIKFRNYTVRWTSDNIVFFTDGVRQGSVLPEKNENNLTLADIMGYQTESSRNEGESLVAPFDQEFYLVIGVSAGGMRYFPDHTYSTNRIPKPWVNFNVKAMANFWKAKEDWFSTWNPPDNALVIDSITVTSI